MYIHVIAKYNTMYDIILSTILGSSFGHVKRTSIFMAAVEHQSSVRNTSRSEHAYFPVVAPGLLVWYLWRQN